VLNELDKTLEEFRNEDSVVHISEFNHIISKVVSEQPVPFIFEKLGARYSHFLIDEFQDTSGLQWQNLLPLIENGLAEGNFSMVVGDAKQAIYRWRGGDVEQFIKLPNIKNSENSPLIADREKSLIRNYKEHPLEKNFRSQRTVIEFNNALFLSLSELLTVDYRNVYEQVAQTVKGGNNGGYVELRFPNREGKKKVDVTATYIKETIDLIRELIAEGWNANEIALLTRTNGEGSQLAAALINAGIEVLSSDSLLIRNSPLIGCLVSLLRALEHPEDKIALADIATYLNKTGKGSYPIHILKSKNFRKETIS
jgi:ATP-dependent exoDNAse (exonuclease V) beta subunit